MATGLTVIPASVQTVCAICIFSWLDVANHIVFMAWLYQNSLSYSAVLLTCVGGENVRMRTSACLKRKYLRCFHESMSRMSVNRPPLIHKRKYPRGAFSCFIRYAELATAWHWVRRLPIIPKKNPTLEAGFFFGAGGENRTLISSLENLHTSRCTTPATVTL